MEKVATRWPLADGLFGLRTPETWTLGHEYPPGNGPLCPAIRRLSPAFPASIPSGVHPADSAPPGHPSAAHGYRSSWSWRWRVQVALELFECHIRPAADPWRSNASYAELGITAISPGFIRWRRTEEIHPRPRRLRAPAWILHRGIDTSPHCPVLDIEVRELRQLLTVR